MSSHHTHEQNIVHPTAHDTTTIGHAAAAEVATTPVGYLPPEFMARREKSGIWVQWDSQHRIWLGCSDERSITAESAQEFEQASPDVMSPAEGYLSVFGQLPGMAKAAMIVGIAQYGRSFHVSVGGFGKLVERLQRFMEQDNGPWAVRPAAHSDRYKERLAFDAIAALGKVTVKAGIELPKNTLFCRHGAAATGCAYCGNIGKASLLLAEVQTGPVDLHAVAKRDSIHVFGNDDYTDALLKGHGDFVELEGKDRVFQRSDFAESGLRVMIYEGADEKDAHIGADKTGAVVNLVPHEIGNPTAARKGDESGPMDIYRIDAAAAALVIRRVFEEYNLDAELLMRALVIDAVPVRALLASGDGTLDPGRIALGVRGNLRQALDYITKMERQKNQLHE
jgi:hypothetical protein